MNDDARVHNERQLALYNATVKFQQTRDYDPVKGNFYNPNKEREYVEQRAEIQKNHHIESPKARLRLNDRTDGELYNIVNNSTLDEVSVVRINLLALFHSMYIYIYMHVWISPMTCAHRDDGFRYSR